MHAGKSPTGNHGTRKSRDQETGSHETRKPDIRVIMTHKANSINSEGRKEQRAIHRTIHRPIQVLKLRFVTLFPG